MSKPSIEDWNAATLSRLGRIARGSLIVGLVALVPLVVGAILDPPQFARAYLAAWLWGLNAALGCQVVLMIYHITGGGWGFLLRRLLEAGSQMLWLMPLGFLPIAATIGELYPWAQAATVASNDLLQSQQPFMSPLWWWLRAATYFCLWLIPTYFLNRWSRASDNSPSPRLSSRLNGISSIGLVIYGITIHFAALDWIISLQPAFHSTISGPLLATQQLATGYACALIVFALVCRQPPIASFLSTKILYDLGNLLLVFVILWSYMWWFEFMLVWIANLPDDVVWYINRVQGGWLAVAITLVVFGFFVPLTLLIQRGVKQEPRLLAAIGCLVVGAQLIFLHWQVLPAFLPGRFADWWISLAAAPAVGGIWLATFLWRLRNNRPLAENDPNVTTAIRLRQTEDWEAEWEDSLAHG